MPQLTYDDQNTLPAFEGGLYDTGPYDLVSRTPGGNVKQLQTLALTTVIAAVAQVSTLTIDTAADADAYTIQIGNFTFTGTSAGTDKTVQRDALKTQMDADTAFSALYEVATSSTDALTVTALRPGTPFTVYETVESSSAWSWATSPANTVGTQIKLTINGYEYLFPCDSTTEEDERDSLLTALQADSRFTDVVDMAATGSGPYNITFTAKTAGVPFTLTFSNTNAIGQAGSGTVTMTTTTANVTGNPVPFGRGMARGTSAGEAVLPSTTGFTFEGVSVNRAKARPKDTSVSPPVTGDAVYNGDEAVPVMRRGRIWVIPEDAVTITSNVYVRHTQGAAATATVGRFRTDADSAKADQVTYARWLTAADAGALALLEVFLPV